MAANLSVSITGSFEDLFNASRQVIAPTQGDLLYAMDLQGERMLERTAQGIDYNGSPFHPYNNKDPYYYYPAGKGSKGVRYESYEAFKQSLGSFVPNLRGADESHMLDQFEVQVDGISFKFRGGDYDTHRAPGSTVTMGIYQSKGFLASLHNTGQAPQPERKFFAISAEDKERIFEDIARRLQARVRKAYGN